MTFEDFISWAEKEMKDWKEYRTLGEVKRQSEGKTLRGKTFIAKYDIQRQVVLQSWPDRKDKEPNKLRLKQVQMIFERFMKASRADKITSSYYQIQTWKAPDKIATPAIAAVLWYWYDAER